MSETDGPRSPELKRVLGELDELLQATLIDIGAKEERADIKECHNPFLRQLLLEAQPENNCYVIYK